ncbi:hypothetical protein CR194_05165 [Salipaludibacillus keqinensis]|uniref:Uncharacterized protein n=1 Tax=Salipaludibacillus keqinensis TaxID=2045207 RepID=A0A323TLS4_9BACI|nr:hypothetical protein [Salipaludibacillus keqinensis]PYZ94914.1 hypothetical protein CR194_05165 [Salipaludibacillus keqinensis]
MLTDRQRKLERIVFNVFHMKYRPVTLEELKLFSQLTETEIRDSFQQNEGNIVEIKRNIFLLKEHVKDYENRKKFGYF